MGCSRDDSFSNAIFKQRKQFSIEHRPQMLKDFLIDDSNSCSSTGFKSFPRKPTHSSSLPIRSLIEKDLNKKSSFIRLSTISAFQAMINAVKNIQFTALRSSSILPRSLSRRLSKNNAYERSRKTNELPDIKATVTIKDIIRWRSFRDMIEENSPPLDFSSSSPHHYITTTTTTTTRTTVSAATTPCSRSSNGSSWCDSDFTAEYLPCRDGNSGKCNDKQEVKVGKINLQRVAGDSMEAEAVRKVEETRQQNSPVSVIDNIEFEEYDDDYESSSFEREKQKLIQNIQRFESLSISLFNLEKWMSMGENNSSEEDDDWIEEEEGVTETNTSHEEVEEDKAWKLLNHVKETISLPLEDYVERITLDFFRDELRRKRYESRSDVFDSEMLRRVKAWVDGEYIRWTGWEKKEAYVDDMEKEGKWVESCEEEQQELVVGIENGIVGVLIDELMIDLIN